MSDTFDKDSNGTTRRRFMIDSAKTACGVALFGLGVGMYGQRQASASVPYVIRPPGALQERKFLAACLRCGQCVRACPYHILRLATPTEVAVTGTPYFIARQVPCELCENRPCIQACPSGALDPQLTDIYKARMGLAVLLDQETCLNYQGLRCDVCYRTCPLINKAITLDAQHNRRSGKHTLFLPKVHSEHCTGCGKCEKACVLETSAIKILPRELAKGELGHHYRLGWEEKNKAGSSLIPEQMDLPDRLPEFGGPGLKELKP